MSDAEFFIVYFVGCVVGLLGGLYIRGPRREAGQ